MVTVTITYIHQVLHLLIVQVLVLQNSSYGKIKIDSSTFNGGLFGSPSITETISAP